MATPKSSIKSTRPSPSYDQEPMDECAESPLGSIFSSSMVQNQRLIEMNHLVDELMSHLGLGGPVDGAEKMAVAPYGRLEEIRESQNHVFRNINDLESKIYDLRRALM